MPYDAASIGALFQSFDWMSEFGHRFPDGPPVVPGSVLDDLLSQTTKFLRKRQIGRARNWFALALHMGGSKTIERVRRHGVLRASKCDFDGDRLRPLVTLVIENAAKLTLSAPELEYFSSVDALLERSAPIKRLLTFIVDELRKRKRFVLKTLIAIVDFKFLIGQVTDRQHAPGINIEYFAEEYAEALSLIIRIFDEFVGLAVDHFNYIDEEYFVRAELYDALLHSACTIKAYEEAELQIDIFSFKATSQKSELVVSPTDTLLEKSVRLGYIQTDMQEVARAFRSLGDHHTGLQSLSDLTEGLSRIGHNKWLPIIESPMPRVVLSLPAVPELVAALSTDGLYREEAMYLEATAKEQFCRPQELLQTEVIQGLSFLDVLKIQRLTNLLVSLIGERLLPFFNAQSLIGLRSLLPVFSELQLSDLLKYVVSDVSARAFLSNMAYEGLEHPARFDIQYTRIVKGGGHFLVPMNILSRSNLLRNMLYRFAPTRKAQDSNQEVSMQQYLYDALSSRFARAAQNIRFSVDGQSLEIDVLVLVEQTLLIIECKSSFHPCDIHELRTSFDHIHKASEQLVRLDRVLRRPDVWASVRQKAKWGDCSFDGVSTCIVTANRMFNGYVAGGSAVRQAYEMVNVLETGVVRIGDADFRVWRGAQFSPADLLDYVAGRTTHKDFFDSMEAHVRRYPLDENRVLSFSTFVLRGQRCYEIAKSRYAQVDGSVSGTN